MNRLAVFVEGQTEQLFVERLIVHLGRGAGFAMQIERASGGRRSRPRIVEIVASREPKQYDHFVLIVDCGQDSRVKSDILDRYDRLVQTGYRHILGVRDLHPNRREDADRVRQGFMFRMQSMPITPVLVLAIMEIEAWFLAEHTHFARIDSHLTLDRISQECDFHPARDDMQLRDHPARDLEDIYFLESLNYQKSRQHVARTIEALDFAQIEQGVAEKFPDLQNFVGVVNGFFQAADGP